MLNKARGMKWLALLIFVLVLALSLAACEPTTPVEYASQAPALLTQENTECLTGLHHVEIDIEDYGVISCELDADAAPVTVTNFVNLVKDGFYDGLSFHRIKSGFMMQGGAPKGDGTGSSRSKITGEFAANGFDNPISHTRGVISMGRANDYNSASCQFFIVHEDSLFLDGNYAAFGYVTDGMDVVDEICRRSENWTKDGNDVVAKANRPIIKEIRYID